MGPWWKMNASTMLFRVPGFGDVGAAGAPRTPRKALLSCWEQQGVMMRFQVVVEDEEEETHGYCFCSSVGGKRDRVGDILDQGLR